MPRKPPSSNAVGIGGLVSTLLVGVGVVLIDKNMPVAIGLAVAGALIAIGLVVWHVIGSRNQQTDQRRAAMAELEVQRRILEAMAAARPSGLAIKAGDGGPGGAGGNIDIRAGDGVAGGRGGDVTISPDGISRSEPRSPRTSRHDPPPPPPSRAS